MVTELVSDLRRFLSDGLYVTTARVRLNGEGEFESLTVVYRVTSVAWPEWYSVSGPDGGATVVWVSEGLGGAFLTRLEMGTSEFHKRLERDVQNAVSKLA